MDYNPDRKMPIFILFVLLVTLLWALITWHAAVFPALIISILGVSLLLLYLPK